jgi:hypothetical protein
MSVRLRSVARGVLGTALQEFFERRSKMLLWDFLTSIFFGLPFGTASVVVAGVPGDEPGDSAVPSGDVPLL